MRRVSPAKLLELAPPPTTEPPFLGVKPTRRKRAGRQSAKLERAIDNVRDRRVGNPDGDWVGATPATLLGLYAILHEGVYGVFPDELADDWMPAFSTARRFLEKTFGGDSLAAVACIKWSWQRERGQWKTRESDFRIGWRYQFSQKLVTDYRTAQRK